MKESKSEKIRRILHSKPLTERNDLFIFIDNKKEFICSAGTSFIGIIQEYLKKWGNLYLGLVALLGPVKPSRMFISLQKKMLKKHRENDIILSIGSGPHTYMGREDIINCDLFDFPNVDIVCDAYSLPIKDSSVDYIINIAMLEHSKEPEKIISEMLRVCNDSGEIFCFVPFVSPFHAAPDDYYRWTKNGARELFKDFKEVEIGIGAGPTSGALWVLQEWLSLVLSFGNRTIKDIIFLILMIFTFPIKYLDIIFEKYPNADKLASGFYIHAKK